MQELEETGSSGDWTMKDGQVIWRGSTLKSGSTKNGVTTHGGQTTFTEGSIENNVQPGKALSEDEVKQLAKSADNQTIKDFTFKEEYMTSSTPMITIQSIEPAQGPQTGKCL